MNQSWRENLQVPPFSLIVLVTLSQYFLGQLRAQAFKFSTEHKSVSTEQIYIFCTELIFISTEYRYIYIFLYGTHIGL